VRYLKASLFCGLTAFLLAAGTFELGMYHAVDLALADLLGLPLQHVAQRDHRVLQYLFFLVAGPGLAWATINIPRRAQKALVGMVVLAEILATPCVFAIHEIYFSPFPLLTAATVALIWGWSYGQTPVGGRKEMLTLLLGHRVSKQTFDTLLNSNRALSADGERRDLTVIVCELFNHDALVAALKLADYVSMTNAFLRNTGDFLVENGGYLDESDGEYVRVIFGAPLPDSDHALSACEAALALTARLEEVNVECLEIWGQELDYRIGIATGEVVLAAFGGRGWGALTVTGECVEFARRLCLANTIYGSRILASQGAVALCEGRLETRPIDRVQRAPDTVSEQIHEVLAPAGAFTEGDSALRDLFEEGLNLFWEKNWAEARARFTEVAEKSGGDAPSLLYLKRIQQIENGGAQLDWTPLKEV
jgi:adenylate cyclase